MKHKARLFTHGETQKLGLKYWETYAQVINWISVRSILAIASIQGLTSRPTEFLIDFFQDNRNVDVFMKLPLQMWVDDNRG